MAESNRDRRWPRMRDVSAAALLVLGLYYGVTFVGQIKGVLVVIFFGVLFALVLSYPIDLLARVMPRWSATLLILVLTVGFAAASIAVVLPYFQAQLQWLADHLPEALSRTERWVQQLGSGVAPRAPSSWQQKVISEFDTVVKQAVPVAFGALSLLSGVLAVLGLALFLAYAPGTYVRGVRMLTPAEHEPVLVEFLHRAGGILQRWMLGMLISMLVTGVLTAVGLALCGISSWLVLGALSCVAEFVPYVGPVLSSIPGILVALAQSPQTALWAAGVYALVQLVESYLIQPLVMKRAVRIQPALHLSAQFAMGSAFGLGGLFVATPLLACLQVAVRYFYVERALGKSS